MSFPAINSNELDLIELIGSGPFKNVYKGRWTSMPKGKQQVAIKKWHRKTISDDLIKALSSSCQLLNHPNILITYGWCLTPKGLSTVTELMHQSLFQVHKNLASKGMRLGLDTNREIMLGVTSGVAYCHLRGHGELHISAHNVLLSENFKEVKICDGGIDKSKILAAHYDPAIDITTRWRAPETFTPEIRNTIEAKQQVDVHALGRVIGGIVTGKVPFAEDSETVAYMKVKNNVQEPIPKHCPSPIVLIIQKCLSLKPQERPTSCQVKAELERPELDSYFLLGEKFAKKVSIISGKEGMKEMMRNVIFPIFLEINPELNYKLNI